MINVLLVWLFGEIEYWFLLIKVVIVFVFLVIGVLMIVGIMGGYVIGFSNFIYKKVLFVGGILMILSVFVVVGFLF